MDEEQVSLFEKKFKWQSIFDLVQLHARLVQFFADLKQIESALQEAIE